ncbi:terpenoid synthase [Armillaria gallica]|uniref:Terpenoid synthase n=1 Tax=Armillaria gallica TaxID=47427 RepID=A0A2H3E710_ARMGA|nr:terpenoid synthase [Armillaria gallica]
MATTTLPTNMVREIGESVRLLLDRCSVDMQTQRAIPFDDELFSLACQEVSRHALILDAKTSKLFGPYIKHGTDTVTTCYNHIQDINCRIYIVLYIACFFYFDDKFIPEYSTSDNVAQDLFACMIGKSSAADPLQQLFCYLMTEAPKCFPNHPASNIVITGTLNFVTAASLDYRTQGMKMPASAKRYTTFTRNISGIADVMGVFIFPASVPVTAYIAAIPDLMVFMLSANDVLSFYKEEVAGEELNRVSLLALCDNSTKTDVLRRLVDSTVEAHNNILDILKPNEEALDAYLSFSNGYIPAHARLSRYRLKELGIFPK